MWCPNYALLDSQIELDIFGKMSLTDHIQNIYHVDSLVKIFGHMGNKVTNNSFESTDLRIS